MSGQAQGLNAALSHRCPTVTSSGSPARRWRLLAAPRSAPTVLRPGQAKAGPPDKLSGPLALGGRVF